MVFRGSWWLLAVCLLSWCCNTWGQSGDSETDTSPTPLVIFQEIGDMINMDTLRKVVEMPIPGVYVVPLEIGKNIMEEMENNALNASSEVCQILANNPYLQQDYISITFSKRLQMLKDLAEKCQIPTMKDMVLVSGKKFKKMMRRLSTHLKRQ